MSSIRPAIRTIEGLISAARQSYEHGRYFEAELYLNRTPEGQLMDIHNMQELDRRISEEKKKEWYIDNCYKLIGMIEDEFKEGTPTRAEYSVAKAVAGYLAELTGDRGILERLEGYEDLM